MHATNLTPLEFNTDLKCVLKVNVGFQSISTSQNLVKILCLNIPRCKTCYRHEKQYIATHRNNTSQYKWSNHPQNQDILLLSSLNINTEKITEQREHKQAKSPKN
jgi:hypothetical protein